MVVFLCSSLLYSQEDTVRITTNLTPEETAELDYNNGLQALQQRDYNTAVELFSKTLVVKPNFDKALANRAVAYTHLKNYNEALADINLAIQSNPANAENYFNKSLVFYGMQLKDSQHVALDNCLRLNGEHADAAYYKGLLSFEDGDYDKAIGYYTISVKSNTAHALAYNDRGSSKREKGDYAGAIDDYLEALKLDTSMALVYNNLGSAYRMNKNYKDAIAAYGKAMQKDDDYLIALNNRGVAHFENNDVAAAKKDFEEVLSKDPKNSFAYNNLCSIALKAKDYKKAKDLATRAISLDAANGPAYYNRGIARQMLREEEGCCSDWKKAFELGVNGAKAFINATCLE